MLGKGRLGRAIVMATLTAVVLTQSAGAAPGDLDPSFASDGRLAVPGLGPFVARAVAIDAADRIVVAGYLCEAGEDATCLNGGNTNLRIARLTPDGGLDAEFGENGVVTTPVGDGRSQAYDVIVQPDGRIVAAGVARVGDRDVFALARYGPDGGLDPAFGTGGIALLPAGSGYASIGDVEPGPGGTLLVAGQAVDGEGIPRMAVARVTSAGALDPAFGTGGVTLGGAGGYGYALALGVTAGGAPFAAGLTGDSADPTTYRFADLATSARGTGARFAEHRLGTAASFANALALLPGGGFLAAGTARDAGDRPVMATVRGQVSGGRVRARLIPVGESAVANDVVAEPTGGAWLVGQTARGGDFGFATVRLDAAGAPLRATEIGWSRYPVARATSAALQRSGKLVTVGIGCTDGSTVSCRGGSPVLLVTRQLGGGFTPTVSAPKTITPAGLRRGLRVTVRLATPARLDVRLLAHGRVLRRVRTARPRASVTLRLRAHAKKGPLRLIVRCRGRSVTRTVRLRG